MFSDIENRVVAFTPSEVQQRTKTMHKYRTEWEEFAAQLSEQDPEPWERETTICIKTFVRPQYLTRLLKSIRERYRHVPIVVTDDGVMKMLPDGACAGGVQCKHLPYFVGITQGRNEALKLVKTKYAIFLDDDMMLIPETNIGCLFDYIEENDVDLVAANLSQRPPYHCLYTKTGDSIEILNGEIVNKESELVTYSHRALNCFIATHESLCAVGWDSVIHGEPEHTDFFYRYSAAGYKICTHLGSTIGEDHALDNEEFTYSYFRRKLRYDYRMYMTEKYGVPNVYGYCPVSQKQLDFKQALLELHHAMAELKVPFAVSYGTALGYHRNRGFIGHDNDIDVVVKKKDLLESSTEFTGRLPRYKFKLLQSFGSLETGKEFTFVHEPTETRVDIFISNSKPHFDYITSYFGEKYDRPLYVKFLPDDKQYETVQWFGKEFRIFSKEAIVAQYGETWKLPVKTAYHSIVTNAMDFLYNTDNGHIADDGPVPCPTDTFMSDFFTQCFAIAQEYSALGHPFTYSRLERDTWTYIAEQNMPWAFVVRDPTANWSITQYQLGQAMSECLRGRRSPQLIIFAGESEDPQPAVEPCWNVTMAPLRVTQVVRPMKKITAYAITNKMAKHLTQCAIWDLTQIVNQFPFGDIYMVTSDIVSHAQGVLLSAEQ